MRDVGRQRLYRLNGHALKPIHDWVKAYEQSWSERFDQLDVNSEMEDGLQDAMDLLEQVAVSLR